jgi:hypothetical protein
VPKAQREGRWAAEGDQRPKAIVTAVYALRFWQLVDHAQLTRLRHA